MFNMKIKRITKDDFQLILNILFVIITITVMMAFVEMFDIVWNEALNNRGVLK